MGNAFSGQHECDGSNIIGAPAPPTGKGTAGNSGNNFPTPNNPNGGQGNVNISGSFNPNIKIGAKLPNQTNMGVLGEIYNKGYLKTNNISIAQKLNLIPRGLIIAYVGGSQIPFGWALCDGTNGTPDLRGKFIYGLDNKKNSNKLYQYGGEESHILNIAEIPSHSHSYVQNSGPGGFLTDASAAGTNYANAMNTGTGGDFTYLNQSTASSHNNMPPFYVVMYIMKL